MFKKNASLVVIVFSLLCFSGCNDDAKIKKALPSDVNIVAREFISAVEKQDFEAAIGLIEPGMREAASEKVNNIIDLFKAGESQEIRPIGVRAQKKDEHNLVQASYQLYYAENAIIATLVVVQKPSENYIISARLDPVRQPLEEFYRFKLSGKTVVHYLILLLWVIVPLFTLYTLWSCIRSSVKWKWIWAVGILLAFFPLYLDWTTGRAFIRVFGVIIGGVSFINPKYSSAILSVGLPIGALVFYFMHIFRKNKKIS